MASYLLLRNNKESGPYKLDELVRQGLKPYDLVWVQGKSAAWRYPSEIGELKPHAPVVEEQPYDRFYKKKSPENTQPTAALNNAPQPDPAPEKKYEKFIPKKSVFVTLPGQKNAPAPAPAPVILVTENPAAAQVSQSNSLEDITDRYTKTLQDRKNKMARRNSWMINLKRVAVVTGLVLTGVLAGLFLQSRSGNQALPGQPAQVAAALSPQLPQESSLPARENPEPAGQPPVQTELPAMAMTKKNQPAAVHQPVQEKTLLAREEEKSEPVMPPPAAIRDNEAKNVGINNLTGERNRQVRTGNDDKEEEIPVIKNKPATGSPLAGLVSVASNDYIRVAFGGIRNLELTVTNDSKYKLDKVTVELQYLKPNEEPLKTEIIQFTGISANTTVTRKIKDTNRGIKVAYKITAIQPQAAETVLSAF